MSMENFKSISGKMATFCKKHGPAIAIMVGMQALQDKELQDLLMQEVLMKKTFEAYKDKVLYEQALDYASK